MLHTIFPAPLLSRWATSHLWFLPRLLKEFPIPQSGGVRVSLSLRSAGPSEKIAKSLPLEPEAEKEISSTVLPMPFLSIQTMS